MAWYLGESGDGAEMEGPRPGQGKVCSICAETKQAAFFSKKQWTEKAHKRKCLVCIDVAGNHARFPDLPETKTAMGLGLTPAELEAMCKYTGATELHPSDVDLTDGRFQRGDALRAMGFNAQHIKRLDTLSRLSRLTGLVDAGGGSSVKSELEHLVLHGGEVRDITSAREKCAHLLECAVAMRDEATYLIDNPEEAYHLADWNKGEALRVRDELLSLCGELEARAGQPEPMNTEAAERMRSKLEKKLVPKLKAEIPKWAERLRFLHAQVLKLHEPAPLLRPESPPAPPPKPIVHEMKEWDAPKEYNPEPDGEELELLRKMRWTQDE